MNIGEGEVTIMNIQMIVHDEKLHFQTRIGVAGATGAILLNTGSLFWPTICLPSFIRIDPVAQTIYVKMSLTFITACRHLSDKNRHFKVFVCAAVVCIYTRIANFLCLPVSVLH